ncbi:MAG: hypothetical protein QOK33_467 [Mycobacterium sp.]|jgi:hypothetical protein|nr:hypothetical protein [Mycobacterium sp.]
MYAVRVGPIGKMEVSTTLDELEKSAGELFSLASAATTPGPERKRMRADGIDSLTLWATSPGDVPSVR